MQLRPVSTTCGDQQEDVGSPPCECLPLIYGPNGAAELSPETRHFWQRIAMIKESVVVNRRRFLQLRYSVVMAD